MKTLTRTSRQLDRISFQKPFLEEYKRGEVPLDIEKDLEVRICQKVFQKKMVLEGEKGNLVEVAVGILGREREQTDEVFYNYICRLMHLSIVRLDLNPAIICLIYYLDYISGAGFRTFHAPCA
jgi:hypothetical protein